MPEAMRRMKCWRLPTVLTMRDSVGERLDRNCRLAGLRPNLIFPRISKKFFGVNENAFALRVGGV